MAKGSVNNMLTPSASENSTTVASATGILRVPSRPRYHFANMKELAKSAQEILLYIGNNTIKDPTVFNFVQSVQNFTSTAPKGDGKLDKVWKILNSIQHDTIQIRKEISKSSTSDSSDSAAMWRFFRAKDWQAGIRSASTPHSDERQGINSVLSQPIPIHYKNRGYTVRAAGRSRCSIYRSRTPTEKQALLSGLGPGTPVAEAAMAEFSLAEGINILLMPPFAMFQSYLVKLGSIESA